MAADLTGEDCEIVKSAPIPRHVAIVAVVVALALLAAGCGHDQRGALRVADPGPCTPVDVAAASDTAAILHRAATEFNKSAWAHAGASGCVFVRVQKVEPATAAQELLTGWPDGASLGPAPAIWVPPSSAWSALVSSRLAAAHQPPLPSTGTGFAHSPLVIAMPAPMARALGATTRPVSWQRLAALAADARGWGAVGHREWGPFRLGLANPTWSTPALDAITAQYQSPSGAAAARALQRAVVYYGASNTPYFTNWMRLGKHRPLDALHYLSAVVTDERSVVAYNQGRTDGTVATGSGISRPAVPLVAVTPAEAAVGADNPIVVLDAPWSTNTARLGAREFARYLMTAGPQADAASSGFRPARGRPDPQLLSATFGVTAAAAAEPSAHGVAPAAVTHALSAWQGDRRPARVMLLVDVSDSMGDPVDQKQPNGPSKIDLVKVALANALAQFGPNDEVGLRIFSTGLPAKPSPDWADLVPVGKFATQRPKLVRAIDALTPRVGSPLYAATDGALASFTSHVDPARINAVILLTDGYNEDDHHNDRTGLLTRVGASPVRFFTVPFSNDADYGTLQAVADATNGALFDARTPQDVINALPAAASGS